MSDKVRWLILGCGGIARKFISDMPYVEGGFVNAVASRSLKKAADFAAEYAIDKYYGSYEQAVADPDIDAVYIATPHTMHLENALTAIEAGKAVLCEKPLTVNSLQAEKMIAAAEKKQVFLMEGMWTRFIPATKKFLELVNQSDGQVRRADISFGFFIDAPPEHRIYNPDLGGGALLDIGVYAASLASLIFKSQPRSIAGKAVKAATGVDISDSICLDYGNGSIASLQLSCCSFMPIEATVSTTTGYIRLCSPFFCSEKIEVCSGDNTTIYELPVKGNGFCYEIEHICNCIKAGKIQSEAMPLEETLQIIQTLDRIREPWRLTYPCE